MALAQSFSYTPLVEIQAWSDLPPGTNLFNTLVVFENYPLDPQRQTQIANLRIRDLRIVEQTNFPLLFVIFPGEQLTLRLTFDPRAFAAGAVEAELEHLATMLRSLSGRAPPGSPTSRCSATPSAATSSTSGTGPRLITAGAATLHGLVEEMAARQPDAMAVSDASRALTYRGLDREANRFAHLLLARGLRVKGVSVSRSIARSRWSSRSSAR